MPFPRCKSRATSQPDTAEEPFDSNRLVLRIEGFGNFLALALVRTPHITADTRRGRSQERMDMLVHVAGRAWMGIVILVEICVGWFVGMVTEVCYDVSRNLNGFACFFHLWWFASWCLMREGVLWVVICLRWIIAGLKGSIGFIEFWHLHCLESSWE